jgi:predicted PurR-regulated permease PerM
MDGTTSKHKIVSWQTNEQGFLLILILLSFVGLTYLFNSFLLPIVFSIILATTTFPLFNLFKKRFSNGVSSAFSTLTVSLLILIPLIYLTTTLGFKGSEFIHNFNLTDKASFTELDNVKLFFVEHELLEKEQADYIGEQFVSNSKELLLNAKNMMLYFSKSLINGSMGILTFLLVSLFSLFFFYRDGERIVKMIKHLSPLDDYYDDLLIKDISYLSSVITISVFLVAFLQGVSFALLTYFIGIDWVFIGVAVAVASFVPVVGAALVWVPLSLFLYSQGLAGEAGLVLFWGIVVAGFIIDNLLRPIVISKITRMFKNNDSIQNGNFSPLNHTLLVVLSTFGGIFTFGVIGLFLGLIIAAFSISIFHVYLIRIKHLEDEVYLVDLIDVDIDNTANTNDISK